jgi:hypothetical protein
VPAFCNLYNRTSLSQYLYQCQPFTISSPVPAFHISLKATSFHNFFNRAASLTKISLTMTDFTISLPVRAFTISLSISAFHNLFICDSLSNSLHPVPAFHNLFTSASLSQYLFQCQPFTISCPVPAFSLLFQCHLSRHLYHIFK